MKVLNYLRIVREPSSEEPSGSERMVLLLADDENTRGEMGDAMDACDLIV